MIPGEFASIFDNIAVYVKTEFSLRRLMLTDSIDVNSQV
jgi:hypothetical protein